MTRPLAVVSGTASDAHMWNLIVLDRMLAEAGYLVRNLGICVPVPLLVEQCRRLSPDLVVLASVNGHGYLDGLSAVRGLRAEPALAGSRIVVGGKLGMAGREDPAARYRPLAAGCDEVFEGSAALADFWAGLRTAQPLVAQQ